MAQPSRVIWTALPQGRTAGGVWLSAMAAIRLQGAPGGKLGDYPAFLRWPVLVQSAVFFAVFGPASGQVVKLSPQPELPGTGDAVGTAQEWWEALFPADTPVIPFAFSQPDASRLVSYDPLPVETNVAGLYGRTAAGADFTPLTLGQLGAAIDGLLQTAPVQAMGGYGAAVASPREGKPPPLPDLKALVAKMDFHARLAALGRHPALLRKLRLVVPFELAPPQTGQVRIIAAWSGGATGSGALPDGAPLTRFDATFLPSGDTNGLIAREGFLDLSGSSIGVLQADVEDAVHKLQGVRQTAANMAALQARDAAAQTATPPGTFDGRYSDEPAELPALGGAGLSLVVKDRAGTLATAFQKQATLENGLSQTPVPKSALTGGAVAAGEAVAAVTENVSQALLRGWRVDVQDADDPTASWRSLHARTTTFTAGTNLQFAVENEGFAGTAAAAQPTDARPDPPLAVHPALTVWRGWSLSVPHPALAVGPSVGDGTDVSAPDNAPLPDLGLGVEQSRARRLPRLRFGRRYRFRARSVDLAGGGLPADAPAPAWAVTGPVTALRSAPLEPPVTTFVQDQSAAIEGPIAGASMDRLTVRTCATGADSEAGTRRLLYPPRGSVHLAELHGKLDEPGGAPDPGLYALLTARDNPNSALRSADVALEWVRAGGALTPAPGSAVAQQLVMPTESAPITYLPDPAAIGMAFALLPVRRSTVAPRLGIRLTFPISWPDRRPLLLVLEAADAGDLHLDETAQVLRIRLPPGEAAELLVSSAVDPAGLQQMLVWSWVREPNAQRALEGRNWAITPHRRLQLVHAVQRPLVVPVPRPLTLAGLQLGALALRLPGERAARVRVTVPTHLNSTGQVDVFTHWTDPVDADGPATATVREQALLAFTRRVTEADFNRPDLPALPASTVTLTLDGVLACPDTRARTVAFRPAALTRYREYMPPAVRQNPGPGLDSALAAPTTPENAAVGHVLSTSNPPPPRVLYVVPTFGWDTPHDGPVMRRTRAGGGLRVYLDRPWFQSGFNEMLAVLVLPDGAPPVDLAVSRAVQYTSRWGQDPIVGSTPLPFPMPRAFAREVRGTTPALEHPSFWNMRWGVPFREAFEALPPLPFRTALEAPGSDGLQIRAVPHLVDWDPERQLWFADIEIGTGATVTPFVRLALARYQPMSVPKLDHGKVMSSGSGGPFADEAGLAVDLAPDPSKMANDEARHLSEVVLTDFVQLLPDRLCTAVPASGGINARDVTVFGHLSNVGNVLGGTPRFVAHMQARAADDSPDLGWRDLPDEEIVSVALPVPIPVSPTASPGQAGAAEQPAIASGLATGAVPGGSAPKAIGGATAAGGIGKLPPGPPVFAWRIGLRGARKSDMLYRVLVLERDFSPSGGAERLVYFDAFDL